MKQHHCQKAEREKGAVLIGIQLLAMAGGNRCLQAAR